MLSQRNLVTISQKKRLEKIFEDIDADKDGKISFDEFFIWWRNGASNKMEALVYLQLKTQKLLSKIHGGLSRLGNTLESKYENIDQSYIAVQSGDASNPTTSIHVHGGLALKDETHRKNIISKLGVNDEDYYFVITVHSSDPSGLTKKLQDIYDTIKTMLT